MNSMYNAILHKTIKVHNPSSQEINQTQSIMIYACPKHEFYMKTWWFNAEKTDKKKGKSPNWTSSSPPTWKFFLEGVVDLYLRLIY